jgi:penicillin-binding protein 2
MNKSMQKRLRFFSAATLLVMLVLTARLAWLQIYRHDYYFSRAETNRIRPLPVTAPRGIIYDRHGEVLAGNRAGFTVSLLDLPKRDRPEVARFLATLLETDEGWIHQRIAERRFSTFAPIRLKNDVSPGVVARVREQQLELPGVIIETQPVRYYPGGGQAAHLLGYVGEISPEELQIAMEQGVAYRAGDNIGKVGLESAWESKLRGRDGTLLVETNRFGQRVSVLDQEPPLPGYNLQLTLDAGLQRTAEQSLAGVITAAREAGNEQAGRGAIVVMDPRSGEILALASYPAFDPNSISLDFPALGKDRDQPLVNKAILGTYAIGSTMKMVGAVAGLEEGVLDERTRIVCSGPKIFFRGENPRGCFRGAVHGALNVVQALAKSCNIFFFELSLRLGIDTMERYAHDFGFGQPTGLQDISGEAHGVFDSRERRRSRGTRWYPGDVLSVAVGQANTRVTPLQLANYAAMLANGGIHYRPRLVRAVTNNQGEEVYRSGPEILRRLDYSEETWHIVRRGLESVTAPGGTAATLFRLPVRIAGKTGTAQVGGRDSLLKPHTLFVGYAPAQAPEIAFAVIFEHGESGALTTLPVVESVVGEYFREAGE